ncbi:MAG: prolyl oligopeptidase family serine peptidase [Caulobacteraceae bacterium]
MKQQGMVFEKEITVRLRLQYLLYLPPEYGADKAKKWPLLVFLHGAGEVGDNLELVKRYAIPRMIEAGQDFPFLVVSPQCHENTYWDMHFEAMDELISDIEDKYAVDSGKIYLTGISMGGFGCFDFAMAYPGRFAAVVPVCGGASYPELAEVIKDVPVWVFHGAIDEAVPVEESEKVVKVLRGCKGNVKFTVYPENGHDVCSLAYLHPGLFEWLLQQRKEVS